jgi:hypothetical protein
MSTNLQSGERIYTCREIALLTGRVAHTVKTLAKRYSSTNHPIGRKPGRDWLFDEADLARIKEIPVRRGRPPGSHAGTTKGLNRPARAGVVSKKGPLAVGSLAEANVTD